uniref:Uncharacterized protein n=1 Tax=Rubinisphaera brasiliensis (strain ATCC 49424 / DSM 5305 / JCM 21570 / IAM 15109 / NBRC 103401 / IFAM 1448) TaxID=756272 RepID=F0SL24_RUBBR|nr:hypothetical protein Plabr_3310 [Rubinisphaera brasiliensis DSM 5305]
MTNLKNCPVCHEPGVDDSQPVQTFWRCRNCHQAVVRRNGRLEAWLDTRQKPKRRRRAVRGRR